LLNLATIHWTTREEVRCGCAEAPGASLQRWPVLKRVNSSKADADDSTLIEKVELAAA